MAYESKAVVTKITAVSRVAIKVKDNFYTVEYTEERTFPEITEDIDMERERSILFDDVNAVVDDQAQQILKSFK